MSRRASLPARSRMPVLSILPESRITCCAEPRSMRPLALARLRRNPVPSTMTRPIARVLDPAFVNTPPVVVNAPPPRTRSSATVLVSNAAVPAPTEPDMPLSRRVPAFDPLVPTNNECGESDSRPPMEKFPAVTIIPEVSRASSPTVSGVLPPTQLPGVIQSSWKGVEVMSTPAAALCAVKMPAATTAMAAKREIPVVMCLPSILFVALPRPPVF